MGEKLTSWCVVLGVLAPCLSMAATVWNPADNDIHPPDVGDWGDADNWGGGSGLPPGPSPGGDPKAVFNVPGAAECRVPGSFSGFYIVQGDNDTGGILRIVSGGTLSTLPGQWAAVGYNSTAHMIVEAGGTVHFGQHMWVGFKPGADATVDISGTVTAGQQFGIGWEGGVGTVNVQDGGLLDLREMHATRSIGPGCVVDVQGTGRMVLPGNYTGVAGDYVDAGKITGNGQAGATYVNVVYDGSADETIVTAAYVPEPPDTRPVLAIRRLGGSDLELSWPIGSRSYVPEATNDLASTGPWNLLDGSANLASNRYTQVVTGDDPSAFYRLILAAVDNTTLSNKSMMGYQGWFGSPNDASLVDDRWHHWGGGYPLITDWGIDFYPDMSEYTDVHEPGWTLNNGDTAYLFSAVDRSSVELHCRWMWEYGIDGVFLQRFLGEVQDSRFEDMRDRVARNIKAGCEAYGRLYAMMYDVSGVDDGNMLGFITNDWHHLVTHGALQITNSPSYAHHNGKPVISIWGLGFKNRNLTPGTAVDIINYFRDEQGMTVMGGVPDGWRNLTGSSETAPAWAAVYRSFDIISPWSVGRPDTLAEVNAWRITKIEPDLAAATAAGADYMPVIFPGFSWYNIKKDEDDPPDLNQTPRLGGEFYWRQAYNAVDSGCVMLYTAMFDEMDEGTAMLKMAETTADLPAGATMVPLDADGISLPSDWYLRVGGEAASMLRGDIPIQGSLPISP